MNDFNKLTVCAYVGAYVRCTCLNDTLHHLNYWSMCMNSSIPIKYMYDVHAHVYAYVT